MKDVNRRQKVLTDDWGRKAQELAGMHQSSSLGSSREGESVKAVAKRPFERKEVATQRQLRQLA